MGIAGLDVSYLLQLGLLLVAVGALSGFLAGVFGIGGGAILVPVFYECFRLAGVPLEVRMPLCVGTSLAIIIPTSIRSYRAHYARGAVDMEILRLWWLPLLIGVLAGSVIARYAPERLFKIVFVTVAWFAAARLLAARRRSPEGTVDARLRLLRRCARHADGCRRRAFCEFADDVSRPDDSSGGCDIVGAGGAGLDSRRARLCLCRLAGGRTLSGRAGAAIAVCNRLRLADRRAASDADQHVDRAARREDGACDVEEDAGARLRQLSLHRRRAVCGQPALAGKAQAQNPTGCNLLEVILFIEFCFVSDKDRL